MSDRRSPEERRLPNQRRRSRDKRRASSESYTVIELAGSDLRVVMLQRSVDESADQVHAVTVRWRHEANSLNTEQGLQELSAALTELADEHDLQTTQLQFVLGGEFCVTKAVRGTSEEVRGELQQIEQRSRLYLMLGPGEKVTVSKSRPLDARHIYAVAAVCNQQTLDTIYEAASQAGMQIDSIEPALVATSRAVGRLSDAPSEPCLLIHLDQAAVELGVCHQGSLLLDYRPGGRTAPEELVELVRTHLSRLQRHVGRQLHEAPPMLKRVYLCGETDAVEKAFSAFSACEQFEVEKVAPAKIKATWKFSELVEDSQTVPALGALLNTYLPESERDAPNFMEHIVASSREPIKPILLRSLMPVAAVLLVALTIFAFNFKAHQSLGELQLQIDSLAADQGRDRILRLQMRSRKSKLVQLRALAEKVQALPAGEVIARIGHCMPSDVWLHNLSIDGMQKIQITGASYLEAVVFDFVNWLDQAPGFEDVALRSTQPGQSAAGPAIDFNVELNIGDWNGPVEEVARNE